MIVSAVTSAVTYYDLDAETVTGTLLVPEHQDSALSTEPQSTPEIKLSVDDHSDSLLLSFNIAFSLYPQSEMYRVSLFWAPPSHSTLPTMRIARPTRLLWNGNRPMELVNLPLAGASSCRPRRKCVLLCFETNLSY